MFWLSRNRITLGNQLDGVHLLDPDIARAYQKHYPDTAMIQKWLPIDA